MIRSELPWFISVGMLHHLITFLKPPDEVNNLCRNQR
jgi:hypothetical protein